MKKIIYLLLTLLIVINVQVYARDVFSDIEGTKYETYVYFLNDKEVINGFPDGTFKAYENVTRAQFCKMIVESQNLKSKSEEERIQFNDVGKNHWAYSWIRIAIQNEIIIGYEDGSFKPEQSVSYAEAVTMILRAMGLEKDMIDRDWPNSYLTFASQNGIFENVTYEDSATPANRGDVSILLVNMINKKQDDISNFFEEKLLVEYETDIGTAPESIEVTKGSSIKLAKGINVKGYSFKGWKYNNETYESGSKIIVNENMTLKAIFELNSTSSQTHNDNIIENSSTNNDVDNQKETKIVPISEDGLINNEYFGIIKDDTSELAAKANKNGITEAIEYASANQIDSIMLETGNYTISADEEKVGYGIQFKSNIKFNLNSSTLYTLPHKNNYSALLYIKDVSNIEIYNGTLIGDKYSHTGDKSKMISGKNIWIPNSDNVYIHDMKIVQSAGDGITIGAKASPASNIKIENCDIDDSSRNGITILWGEDIDIKNNSIHNTNGGVLHYGIDLEGSWYKQTYKNVTISDNNIFDNKGIASVNVFDNADNIKVINNGLSGRIQARRTADRSFPRTFADDVTAETIGIFVKGNKVINSSLVKHSEWMYVKDDYSEEDGKQKVNELFIEKRIQKVTLQKEEIELTVGSSKEVRAQQFPEDATHLGLKWSSSDERIVKVSSTGKTTSLARGKIEAISVGTAIITGITTDGSNISVECTVNVIAE